ncbi:MAG: hypothetical protein GF311_11350 [Candidatus Lokiarchaeota archaeon]|nr:hypothetical protein [Candidatus Lokiarchaeota archaeon]
MTFSVFIDLGLSDINNGYQNSTDINGSSNLEESSILWKFDNGLPGTGATMQPRLVNISEGEQIIVIGMDQGLATISLEGNILMSYSTFGEVMDFTLLDDISGDNQKDIALITYDQNTYNLMVISSNDGTELWKYKATIQGFDSETYERKEFITYIWDVIAINDITSDGISDLVISSWYRLIALNGKTGEIVRSDENSFSDDVWRLGTLEDTNGNGYEEIIAGSQDGNLKSIDSKTGNIHWNYEVPETIYQTQTYSMGLTEIEFINSINDFKIMKDLNNDGYQEILISADDGNIRLISGNNGVLIDDALCYNITIPENLIYPQMGQTTEYYYSARARFFARSGLEIFDIPDLNHDDEEDYFSIGFNLGYETYLEDLGTVNNNFQANVFSLDDQGSEKISEEYDFEWQEGFFSQNSRPEIIIDSGDNINFYFYGRTDSQTASLKKYNISDTNFDNLLKNKYSITYDFSTYGMYSSSEISYIGFYLLNIGDINDDGIDDLFAISAEGRYFCVDGDNDEILWEHIGKNQKIEYEEVSDINEDGVNDYLIKKISNFYPDWIEYSENDEIPTIIENTFVIDGKSGDVIWRANLPNSEYYDGVRDIKNVGDINGDGVNEFAVWCIPSTIPDALNNTINSIAGEGYGATIEPNIYRALLYNYTRFILFNGKDGEILWNTNIIEFPYAFYRQFSYQGSYTEPSLGSSTGKDFYNRIDKQTPSSWRSGSDISWNSKWDPITMMNASFLELDYGNSNDGINELLNNDEIFYSITSELDDTVHKALLKITIPVEFDADNNLGIKPYLSKLERISALKMQTELKANVSSTFHFNYELFDPINDEWIVCNWNNSENTWDDNQYPDLKGGYNTMERTSYNNFSIGNSLKTDSMYIITRGTKDADNYVEFDYGNATNLSKYLNSENNITLRLNITNINEPFNLSIDSFGLGVFYWGLFDGAKNDKYYLWDYNSGDFTDANLLDLTIQDFKVVNSTDDSYLDILVVIGKGNDWSSMISVFNLKHETISTHWAIDNNNLPNGEINILPMDNTVHDKWLLTGDFNAAGCKHLLISDSHWDQTQSHLENYSLDANPFEYTWEITAGLSSPNYEFPGKIVFTESGDLGVICGEYDGSDQLTALRIINGSNGDLISKISRNIDGSTLLRFKQESFEFDSGLSYQIILSHTDFDNDGYLDHLGMYSESSEYIIRVLDGNSKTSEEIFSQSYTYPSYIDRPSNKFQLPAAPIKDLNQNNRKDLIVGIQFESEYEGNNLYCGYSAIKAYDTQTRLEIMSKKWEIFPKECTQSYYYDEGYIKDTFFQKIHQIGDINSDLESEYLVMRNNYIETSRTGYYSNHYETEPVIEIIDFINKRIMYRLNFGLDSVLITGDMNGDNSNEMIISNENSVICVNSKFSLEITNLEYGKTVSNDFTIECSIDTKFDYLEVYVDDVKYTSTKDKNIFMSLGAGQRKIDVLMYDESGFITYINSVNIFVTSNNLQLILTFVIAGVAIGAFILYKRFTKKRKEMILIEKRQTGGIERK